MASTTILSDNGASSGSAGLKSTAGNDGVLILQTTTSGGTATNALSISNTQAITVVNTGTGVTFSSSAGSGLRVYGASGTNQWDMYLNSTNLRFSDNTGGGRIVIDGTASVGTTFGVGGATPSASGAGITFPATQSASSDANTLDDYEEGTWTPTDGSGAGLSFSSAYGYYIKVGKMVYVQAKIIYPSTANTNNTQVNGLPFSMSNTNPYNYPIGACGANGNTFALRAYGFGSSFAFLNSTDGSSTNANLSAANINFNFTYIASS